MKQTELHPHNNQKSFYGKATILELDSSRKALKSYNTLVCELRNGKFVKTWNGYSATTMKHVNAFRQEFNLPKLTKKEWDSLTLESEVQA